MSREQTMIENLNSTIFESPKEKLDNHFLKKGYNGILVLGKFFRRIDRHSKGTVSLVEISEAVRRDGLRMSKEELTALFQGHDANGDGNIDYNEFLSTARPEMNEARQEVVKEAFAKLDASNDGSITLADIKDKFTATSHPSVADGSETEDDVWQRFLARFEGNTTQDGKVTLNEFLDYYSGISKSIDDDEYFIEVVKHSWGL